MPYLWRFNHLSAELVVDSPQFQLYLGMDQTKALISLTVFETKNEMHMHIGSGSRVPATFREFALPSRSHHAHSLSSVAKSPLTQLDMLLFVVV